MFGPQQQLLPQPDLITDNSLGNERQTAIGNLNHPFKNRDCRWVARGGPPRAPGVPAYPNSTHWEHYINRFLLPELLTNEEVKNFYTVDHQTLYTLVNEFAVPFLLRGGPAGGILRPHRMTGDLLMAMLLLKMHENINDRLLGPMFGESASTVNRWEHGLRDYMYQNDRWLQRGRNLSNVK